MIEEVKNDTKIFCFYFGRKFITQVIADTPTQAWGKAIQQANLHPTICPRPYGICIDEESIYKYFDSLEY